MSDGRDEYDLVVIGGGSAGLVLGEYGARLGARVAIVEAERLGGDCTWNGCVPSKALLAAAHTAHLVRRTQDYGLPPATLPEIDLGEVMDRIRALQEKIYREHDNPKDLEALGCDVIRGRGRFVGRDTLEVEGRQIRARTFCIATGSRPAVPPIEGIEGVPYLTNETIFDLRAAPGRLLVVGGGPIGVELGQALARLGSTVTIAEMGPQLLPEDDPEMAERLKAALEREGITILLETESTRVEAREGETRVTLKDKQGTREVACDALLVATGRTPSIEHLALEAAGVAFDREKGIQVDEALRTTNPRIYACGDVIGRYPFTHMAAYEATVVLRNALFPLASAPSYRSVPWATFTDPAVAHAGLTEEAARARYGRAVHVYRYPFAETDRAITDRRTEGLVKLVCVGLRERIVGAQIIGPAAGELIHEVLVAMRAGMSARELASTLHIYPTLSQAPRYAAQESLERWLASPLLGAALRGYFRLWRRVARWRAGRQSAR